MLSAEDHDLLYRDDLALSNLHADWAREIFEGAVEQIVARHVAAALTEAADAIEADPHLFFDRAAGREVPKTAKQVRSTAARIIRNLAAKRTP